MSSAAATLKRLRWSEAWPDALAFAIGLGVAWFAHWEARDLVWSLWLASLVVGYATIVWSISAGLRELIKGMRANSEPVTTGPALGVIAVIGAGALFMLAFFTVHFGGFHFVHSVFINVFFPIEPGQRDFPGWSVYAEVIKRYWIFLPAAFIAERAAFASKLPVKPDATATPQEKAGKAVENSLTLPYKNVVRMHILIFFFAGAYFAKLDSFIIYAVVYAVYFFPWRLVKAETPPTGFDAR